MGSMKETFRDCDFQGDSLARIKQCEEILDNYQEQGLRLTLRQLFYQLVSHHGLPNTERSYKGLGNLVSKARLAGLLDWDAIEDRVRTPKTQQDWSSPASFLDAA